MERRRIIMLRKILVIKQNCLMLSIKFNFFLSNSKIQHEIVEFYYNLHLMQL
jgi:hypothetical protein